MGSLGRGRASGVVVAAIALMLAAPAASAKVVINYWDKWGAAQGEYIQSVVDHYNKSQSRVEVRYMMVQADQIQAKFLTATIAGAGPDVIGLWNHRVAMFEKAGLVRPLDAYLPAMGITRNSLLPRYMDMSSIDGKVYALPITNSIFALYINQGALAKSGLDASTAPQSFDDMVDIGDKVTRHDATGRYTRVGFALNDPGWWPYIWPVAFGAELYDEKNDTVDLNQPAMLKAYNFVQSMAKHWSPNILGVLKAGGNGTKGGALFSGKTVMELNGSWLPGTLAVTGVKLNYSVHAIPYGGERKQPWVWLESDMVFMAKSSKHPNEAADFLKYLMGPEGQRELNLKRECHSAVKAVDTADFYKANGNPALEQLVKLAASNQADFAPKTIIWSPDLDTTVYATLFDTIWNQKKSPTQALNDMKGPLGVALKKVQRRKR